MIEIEIDENHIKASLSLYMYKHNHAPPIESIESIE